jgi:ubiquinone biosynthesis protein UbiJ
MPRPRKYATDAEKQAAYRARQGERIRAVIEGRRPAAPAIGNMPAERRWTVLREQARETLEQLRDEMQEYHDARSDEWREGERGQAMGDRLDGLEQLLSDLEALA